MYPGRIGTFGLAVVVLLLVNPVGAHAQVPATDQGWLDAYQAALRQPPVAAASLEYVIAQIRRNPPVAFAEGYWVSPIDLFGLFADPVVRATLDSTSGGRPTALAFTPTALTQPLALPYVGTFTWIEEKDTQVTSVFVAAVQDPDNVVIERLPPPHTDPVDEPECYFFCGDPDAWDFDGDGSPNTTDLDDDGDGVPDQADHYPYWAGGSDCDCDIQYIGLTDKFSEGIKEAVLAAWGLIESVGTDATSEKLGSISDATGDIRFVFPDLPDGCPNACDPSVRYVSTDPNDCARLRFRCADDEEPFSNECGCGCQRR